MVLYVRELEQAEREELASWLSSDDAELRHRARVVLLSADGYRIPEIAQTLNSHSANLRKWIHRFNTMSCQGLITVRSGGGQAAL